MARYIDADLLLDKLKEHGKEITGQRKMTLYAFRMLVNELPSFEIDECEESEGMECKNG